MIEIDIPMDLDLVPDGDNAQGRINRSRARPKEGGLLVAGRPSKWSWARVLAVYDQCVTFSLVTEEEAAHGTRVATDVVRADWPWPNVPWLRVEESTLAQADRSTFMWVGHIQFSLDSDLDDQSLIAGLISSNLYAHGYASPYAHGGEVDFDGRPVHGPYLAEKLTAEMFRPISADAARHTIHTWLDDEMFEPPQSARAHDRIDRLVRRGLDIGDVYCLDVPDDDVYRSNWVGVGTTGFHEFVTIDRERSAMHLVVASDD